jgi:hypothetical protein
MSQSSKHNISVFIYFKDTYKNYVQIIKFFTRFNKIWSEFNTVIRVSQISLFFHLWLDVCFYVEVAEIH